MFITMRQRQFPVHLKFTKRNRTNRAITITNTNILLLSPRDRRKTHNIFATSTVIHMIIRMITDIHAAMIILTTIHMTIATAAPIAMIISHR